MSDNRDRERDDPPGAGAIEYAYSLMARKAGITYSYDPTGRWTARHQTSLQGKRTDFTLEDFRAFGKTASMKRGRAEEIVEDVHKAVQMWPETAAEVGVPPIDIQQIRNAHRLDLLS